MSQERLSSSTDLASQLEILRTTSLTQAVEGELERMIVGGELAGGSHVSEQALAQKLGVSRGPVREAFRSLEQAGLLVSIRNRGVFVRLIDLAEVLELYSVRAALEGEMASSLFGQVTPALEKRLRQVVRDMRKVARSKDFAAFYPLNIRFHEFLADACTNRRLVATYRGVVRDLHLYRRESLDRFGSLQGSADAHARLIEILLAEPEAVIREEFRAHVLTGRERLERGHTQP
ncbi:FCD domain-containing protein [Roseomonas elaeocarpi]|uniref:FCD domain-containing protein n=1 Tax=Roseomonas elaeocarpi TaxID=907779 RepID=A0ABV6JN00_9PROT